MDICHHLMQTALTIFFALTTPETSSLPLQSVHNDSRHNEERSQTFHPHNTVVPVQDKKAVSILFTQHNVESMHMQRLLEISRLASVEGVLIMTCQGTRWKFSNTINTPTHRCFSRHAGPLRRKHMLATLSSWHTLFYKDLWQALVALTHIGPS